MIEATQHIQKLWLERRLKQSGVSWELTNREHPFWKETPSFRLIVVMNSFSPQNYLESLLGLMACTSPELKQSWFKRFTPTVFLAGNPLKMNNRTRFDYISKDETIGWVWEKEENRTRLSYTLRQLKMLRTAGAFYLRNHQNDQQLDTDAYAHQQLNIHIPLNGQTFSDFIIHFNHLISEAIILKIINGREVLNFFYQNCVTIKDTDCCLYARVKEDERKLGLLKTYALIR
jgi:hypothetical protein